MSNISFFSKGAFVRRKHLLRVSSMIRADQIAEYLGARINPTEGYDNDICIYVKPHKKPDEDLMFEGRPYLDIIDGWGLLPLLMRHPEVTVIACSQFDYENLSRILPNKVVLIPQHHCNFERAIRTRKEVTTVGVIGTEEAFIHLPVDLEEKLTSRGMELIRFSQFSTRQDIVDFYKKIDVQMVWRPYKLRLGNPLKLVNAASFGIPTIALQEDYFKEMNGYYSPVRTLEEFILQLDLLRMSPSVYTDYSDNCRRKAEEYHIEKIAELYKNLCI